MTCLQDVSPARPDAACRVAPWRRRALAALLLVPLAGCASRRRPDPLAPTRALLAPSGRLRVGLVRNSPVSIVGDPMAPDARGVGWALGRALANRLDAPFEAVLFPRNADVIAALGERRIDLAFMAVGPTAPHDLVFSAPFLHVEQGALVPAASPIRTLADAERAGTRVGVLAGDEAQPALAAAFRQARLVPVPAPTAGIAMLAARELDAFAGDKPTLGRMAESLRGARLLDGRWGVAGIAAALPGSREPGLAYVQRFLADAEREGLIDRAAEAAGVRAAPPTLGR